MVLVLPRYVTTRECSAGERLDVVKNSWKKIPPTGFVVMLKGTGEPPSIVYVAKGPSMGFSGGTTPYQLRDVPVCCWGVVRSE